MGWKERCNHVADQHMKKEGRNKTEWKYSNEIHNLLRQEATRHAWKRLLSALETKEAKYLITWIPENTRTLKQKLQCSDMRPDVDTVVQTALELRHGRPYNEVIELDPRFKTPSLATIPNFRILSDDQRDQILGGVPAEQVSSSRGASLLPPAYTPTDDHMATPAEPHPGSLVEYDMVSLNGSSLAFASGKRNSYIMDIDLESLGMPTEPDPIVPFGIDQDPSDFGFGSSSRSGDLSYADNHMATPPEGSPPQRRSSKGHHFPRSIKVFANRLSPK